MKLDPDACFKISTGDWSILVWLYQVSAVTFCVWGKESSHPSPLRLVALLVAKGRVHAEGESRITGCY